MSVYEPFKSFAEQIGARAVDLMSNGYLVPVVRGDISGDDIWGLYLENIPVEHNPILRERRYYDGNYDRSFVRRFGHVLWIDESGNISTIWEVDGGSYLHKVARALDLKLRSGSPQVCRYILHPATYGRESGYDNDGILHHHFAAKAQGNIASMLGASVMAGVNSRAQTLLSRASGEHVEALRAVLELIDSNQIYHGRKYRGLIADWLKFADGDRQSIQRRAVWQCSKSIALDGVSTSPISTLVQNLVEGVQPEDAVRRFEATVAPANYRRTTTVATTAMINHATHELSNNGLGWLMNRKIATVSDVANNFIFRTPGDSYGLSLIDKLKREANSTISGGSKLKLVDIDSREFVQRLPSAHSVEIAPGHSHRTNRFVITRNESSDGGSLAWGNDYGWTYLNGWTSNAVRERVERAGGNVDAPVRISLAWSNSDDLDLYVRGAFDRLDEIVCASSHSHIDKILGYRDTDMNVNGENSVDPAENVYFDDISILNSWLDVSVDSFNRHSSCPEGYEVHVMAGAARAAVRSKSNQPGGFSVRINKDGELEFKNLCGVEVLEESIGRKWVPVIGISHSPNYWSGASGSGQKHLMLFTEDFVIDGPVRTLFRGHLSANLREHYKAIDIIATRVFDEPRCCERYARGYGFSSASGQSFITRITDTDGRKTVYRVTT